MLETEREGWKVGVETATAGDLAVARRPEKGDEPGFEAGAFDRVDDRRRSEIRADAPANDDDVRRGGQGLEVLNQSGAQVAALADVERWIEPARRVEGVENVDARNRSGYPIRLFGAEEERSDPG